MAEEAQWLCRALQLAREAWAATYRGLLERTAQLDRLREYGRLLMRERERHALEATAAGLQLSEGASLLLALGAFGSAEPPAVASPPLSPRDRPPSRAARVTSSRTGAPLKRRGVADLESPPVVAPRGVAVSTESHRDVVRLEVDADRRRVVREEGADHGRTAAAAARKLEHAALKVERPQRRRRARRLPWPNLVAHRRARNLESDHQRRQCRRAAQVVHRELQTAG